MINRNSNYTVPQTVISKIDQNKNNSEKTKPTLQNMNDLYGIYCSVQIPYFPAAAATKAAQDRTKALENYIKVNNLDIASVQNLEHFFAKTKKDIDAGKYGGAMSASQILNMQFMDYIENGYDPTTRPEAELKPAMDELRNEYSNIVKNRLELKPQIEDIRNNYQLPEDMERIDTIVKNHIQKSFDIFK